MAGERYLTRDHQTIRRWAEARDAKPAAVAATGGDGEPGILRLDFPGYSGAVSLEVIAWDEWLSKFDQNDLVLLYQETTSDGSQSNFNKLLKAETADQSAASAKWVGSQA